MGSGRGDSDIGLIINGLPRHPDLVLSKYKTCIFINGCFWHGHNVVLPQMDKEEWMIENSAYCKIPKTNTEFYVKKIARNQERDLEVKHQLNQMGWNCITIWEWELKPAKCEATLQSLAFTLNKIFLQNNRVKTYGVHEVNSDAIDEVVVTTLTTLYP